MLPLIAFWPLLRAENSLRPQLWAKPTLTGVSSVFGWFFNLVSLLGNRVTAAASVGVVAIIVSDYVREDSDSRDLFHEKVLVLGLLALPLAVLSR